MCACGVSYSLVVGVQYRLVVSRRPTTTTSSGCLRLVRRRRCSGWRSSRHAATHASVAAVIRDYHGATRGSSIRGAWTTLSRCSGCCAILRDCRAGASSACKVSRVRVGWQPGRGGWVSGGSGGAVTAGVLWSGAGGQSWGGACTTSSHRELLLVAAWVHRPT
jgi:hypothetical protein